MNHQLKILDYCRRNLIMLFALPIILISSIYIYYGEIFDIFFSINYDFSNIYAVSKQLKIFESDIPLPTTVKVVGYFASQFINILFAGWLISCLITSYLRLSSKSGAKADILIEIILITIIYSVFIVPGLKIWIAIISGLIITAVFVMLFLYWNYERVIINEKK